MHLLYNLWFLLLKVLVLLICLLWIKVSCCFFFRCDMNEKGLWFILKQPVARLHHAASVEFRSEKFPGPTSYCTIVIKTVYGSMGRCQVLLGDKISFSRFPGRCLFWLWLKLRKHKSSLAGSYVYQERESGWNYRRWWLVTMLLVRWSSSIIWPSLSTYLRDILEDRWALQNANTRAGFDTGTFQKNCFELQKD